MTGHIAFALAAVLVVVAVKWISDRSHLPFTVLLTVAGLVYALLPGRNLILEPDVVLFLILPPLLYNAALQSSLIAMRTYLRPIASLSLGLVLVTALVVGLVVQAIVPGLPLAAAIALGAAVAPPDPVASLSIGRRAGLPPRLITVIEGEGLLNDATALTTYQVAIAAAVGGGFSVGEAGAQFALAAVGGLAVGLALSWVLSLPRKLIADPLTGNALSLATPFAAFLIGEELHVSGVLAVVVTGLVAGHNSPRHDSGASRLQTSAVWRLVDFMLEGLVFLLIGQQLPEVVDGLDAYSTSTVVAAAGATVGIVLVLRPLWLFLTQLLPRSLHARLGGGSASRERRLGVAETVALGWAGTRGVITLATVYAIPITLDDGRPFPGRDLLLFCAYLVVVVTLLGQGTTFSWLVRRLGVQASPADEARLRNEARLAAVDAALQRLDRMSEAGEITEQVLAKMREVLEDRQHRYARRLDSLGSDDDGGSGRPVDYAAAVAARRATIEAQHNELLRWRDAGKLPDASLRQLQRELDHEERILPDAGR